MTFHLIGSISSVSVVSSPSLDSLPPQQGQAVGDGRTTRSRGRWAGRGARTGWPRGGLSGRRVRPSLPAAFSALAASSLAAATSSPSWSSSWSISLRPRSDEAPYLSRFEPGNQQLEMCHHRLGTGGTRLGLAPRHLLGRER